MRLQRWNTRWRGREREEDERGWNEVKPLRRRRRHPIVCQSFMCSNPLSHFSQRERGKGLVVDNVSFIPSFLSPLFSFSEEGAEHANEAG